MVLLTSSQVSVALSSAIICFFSLALFLAGYVLQQQTVRSLQDAIKPRIPSPNANIRQNTLPTPDLAPRSSKDLFSIKNGASRTKARSQDLVNVEWNKLAYLKMVKSHEELCSAIMLFADLVRSKSPVQRVLMFPQHWALADSTGDDKDEDPQLYTTKRLLRKAARRYRVTLVPMGTVQPGLEETEVSSYSIAPAFSLRDFDRIILLPKAGVVLNSMPLDSFLAFSEPTEAVSLLSQTTETLAGPLLLQPAKADYTALTTRLRSSKDSITDLGLLQDSFSSLPLLPSLDDGVILYTTTSSLHAHPANPGPATEFNATHFLQNTAFVKLEDEGLPGPEFDVPYAIRAEARPRNDQARKVWERMYEKFRAGRQDVCGLELDPWVHVAVDDSPRAQVGREL